MPKRVLECGGKIETYTNIQIMILYKILENTQSTGGRENNSLYRQETMYLRNSRVPEAYNRGEVITAEGGRSPVA
jgi:hypothetical protein